jgi:DNA-binding MarR family transcriptional regulator
MTKLSDIQILAWRNFITSHALLIDRIDNELAATQQIPLHDYDVLIELAEAPDHRLRLSDLADRVVLTRGGITRAVKKLEEAGMLTRETDPQDRRGVYAILTEQGHIALSKAWSIYAQGIMAHFAHHLSEDEARQLSTIFERMISAIRETDG